MNTFANSLENFGNVTYTENGGVARTTTGSALYDLFALGAAYRTRPDEDCILLFKNAYDENPELALKCLFYLRDCRGGQGERRFFRVVFQWFARWKPKKASKLISYLSEYGRYDDMFILFDTPLESLMVQFLKKQLELDIACKTPSLVAKWMPSENASARKTIEMARKFIKAFGMTSKKYRKMLTNLRAKIKIVETLMSQNRWDEIEFDKIPSKAGLKYRNAFARRDIIAKKYEQFIKSDKTKVNAKTLYPYELVAEAIKYVHHGSHIPDPEREVLEKYWNNLPDYCEGNDAKMMCVIDTSGSMMGRTAAAPINVAIALGMYCAERLSGPFKDHFISFASRPQYIKIDGIDFVGKVWNIFRKSLIDNTNLEATFDLIYNTAMRSDVNKEDVPDTIIILSDMEIDEATRNIDWFRNDRTDLNQEQVKTMMEQQREKWAAAGLKMPKLIYWNIESRGENKILDNGPGVTYVSGASASTFEAILKGKTGIDMMMDILLSERYAAIKID